MDEKQFAKLETPTKKIFISGGGPVGLMLAIGLVQKGFSVILAEKNADFASQGAAHHGSFDGRVLALTYASKLFLESLNLWSLLKPKVTPIHSVHVSQKGFSVILAEKNADFASEGAAHHGSFDGRVLALTYAS